MPVNILNAIFMPKKKNSYTPKGECATAAVFVSFLALSGPNFVIFKWNSGAHIPDQKKNLIRDGQE